MTCHLSRTLLVKRKERRDAEVALRLLQGAQISFLPILFLADAEKHFKLEYPAILLC